MEPTQPLESSPADVIRLFPDHITVVLNKKGDEPESAELTFSREPSASPTILTFGKISRHSSDARFTHDFEDFRQRAADLHAAARQFLDETSLWVEGQRTPSGPTPLQSFERYQREVTSPGAEATIFLILADNSNESPDGMIDGLALAINFKAPTKSDIHITIAAGSPELALFHRSDPVPLAPLNRGG